MVIAVPIPSTAKDRLKRRARWVVNGVETDTTISEFGSFWRVHKEGVADAKVFSDLTFNMRKFFRPSDAWQRLLTVRPTPALPWRSPVGPTLQALTSEPERIIVPHFPPEGGRNWNVFSDRPASDGFFIPTTAPFRIFDRFAVLDPNVHALRRTPVQFMGTGRFGFPAFTAWADISVRNVLNVRAAGFGFWLPRTKFWIPHDPTPLQRVRAAVVASKTLRDKILLRTGPTPRFAADGKPVLADSGTIIVGRP